jgi:hypothetical protein
MSMQIKTHMPSMRARSHRCGRPCKRIDESAVSELRTAVRHHRLSRKGLESGAAENELYDSGNPMQPSDDGAIARG